MLLHHARTAARFSDGDLVLLEDQDRSLWNRSMIEEGSRLTGEALRAGVGAYGVQAAIAAIHAEARDSSGTDWAQIVGLYDVLLRLQPSPVVELNRIVAIAMDRGAEAAVALLDRLQGLDDYCPFWIAKAELSRRAGDLANAAGAYERALALTPQGSQSRFLQRTLAEITVAESLRASS
jgi:RNA polymerase sigma-70 factor (ECF subfamily)